MVSESLSISLIQGVRMLDFLCENSMVEVGGKRNSCKEGGSYTKS